VCIKRYATDNDLDEPAPEVSGEVKSDLAALLARLGG
jgi:hypothetical protein